MMALPAIMPTARPTTALPTSNSGSFAAFLGAVCQDISAQVDAPCADAGVAGLTAPQEPAPDGKSTDIARASIPQPMATPKPITKSTIGCPGVAELPFITPLADQLVFEEMSDEAEVPVQTASADPVSLAVAQSLTVDAPGLIPSPATPDRQNVALAINAARWMPPSGSVSPAAVDILVDTAKKAIPQVNVPHAASPLPVDNAKEQARAGTHVPSTNELSQPTALTFQLPTQVQIIAADPLAKIANAKQLDLTQDKVWVESLARDIAMAAQADGRVRFRLIPEFLGKLDISLIQNAGNVDVQFQTQSDIATRIISAEQPRLIEDLRLSGLKIGEFTMTTSQRDGSPRQHTPPQSQHDPMAGQLEKQPNPKRNGRFA